MDDFVVPQAVEAALSCQNKLSVLVVPHHRYLRVIKGLIETIEPNLEVISMPDWDCPPYQGIAISVEVMGARVSALKRWRELASTDKKVVLLTTIASVCQKLDANWAGSPPSIGVALNKTLDMQEMSEKLVELGYERQDICRQYGDFSIRGFVLDVFCPNETGAPTRIELWDDTVESIRYFDKDSQQSKKQAASAASDAPAAGLESITILPFHEIPFGSDSLAAFRSRIRQLLKRHLNAEDKWIQSLANGTRVDGFHLLAPLFCDNMLTLDKVINALATAGKANKNPVWILPIGHESLIADHLERIEDAYQARVEEEASHIPLVAPSELYMTSEEWRKISQEIKQETSSASAGSGDKEPAIRQQKFFSSSLLGGDAKGDDRGDYRGEDRGDIFSQFKAGLSAHAGRRVFFSCLNPASAARIQELFDKNGIAIAVSESELLHGWVSQKIAFFTECDLFGKPLIRDVSSKRRRRKSAEILQLGSLEVGDYVIDEENGVGQFQGLKRVAHEGALHECVLMIYRDKDRLLIPVENMDRLSLYAKAGAEVTTDRLGSASWQERKARIKRDLLERAQALLEEAAKRHATQVTPMQVPDDMSSFAADWDFEETEDQTQAISEVVADLCSSTPVERLVCGDVGFGKTEVALRAAFITARNKGQCMLLCPTTLLAQQLAAVFRKRLEKWNISSDVISRMVPQKDRLQRIADFNASKIDVLIGTHALLSDKVNPKNLRLTIIDEEQHFGVNQKEKIKRLSANTHIISLSATPIPRSLQLSVSSIRELSLITTPPAGRMAVRTQVMAFDPVSIKEAIDLELSRSGQVFIVAPQISDIPSLEDFIAKGSSHWSYAIAHGGLSASGLATAMNKFSNKKVSILLATAIIESGLDLPNANTIIVYRANRFGLSQLYQLRGRIGRSDRRAYCIISYLPHEALTDNSRKRLASIQRLNYLGAGFALASEDLDIRGAGNVLGTQQSGHIKEIGIELYMKFFRQAVESQKEKSKTNKDASPKESKDASQEENQEATSQDESQPSPQLNLASDMYIPETYVKDMVLRMNLYRELSEVNGEDDLSSIRSAWRDRFGKLPLSVEHLFTAVQIKLACRQANIKRLDLGSGGARIFFFQDSPRRPDKILELANRHPRQFQIRPDNSLVILAGWTSSDTRLSSVLKVINALNRKTERARMSA